ncbi:MAG: tetrahydromethanopterin S-methyltransferase subunit A [Methanosarcinales archaeon Met12]|nr:MAG: tetrahydromethanopterin S-methyltransferase subunit A [Methanosarcinales archaeon Met12]
MDEEWPVVKGDYRIGNKESRICIVTLSSHFELPPEEMKKVALIGPCHTENLGIEKIIANTISNPNIRFILVCGEESRGHKSGQTLAAIHATGIDESGKIIDSDGAIPFIENLPNDAIERFRAQVNIIEHIGETDLESILRTVEEHYKKGEAFPEPPMVIQTVKRKRKKEKMVVCGEGDIIISGDVSLDSVSGIIT